MYFMTGNGNENGLKIYNQIAKTAGLLMIYLDVHVKCARVKLDEVSETVAGTDVGKKRFKVGL